ncbi:MAG: response regulator transcription factor [Terrimicrobiaceae bacterium]
MKKITVLLADDHIVVREGLRMLVETEGDIEVVGEAKTGREAVDLTVELHPKVVVMDIAMPLLNGLQATREILRIFPETRVLILSAHADPEYVEHVVSLGGAGYLIKQTSADILVEAIRQVNNGKTFFSPSISKYLREHYQKTPHTAGLRKRKSACLTSREEGVLQLIAEGKANKQIASELGISIKTVEKHRQHLMQKLSIHDIAGLTRYAIAAGVIESSVQPTTNDRAEMRKSRGFRRSVAEKGEGMG